MNNDIIGGVSPLKKRQSSRGGKRAGQATATGKRRGGFAKSKGVRGGGGRNVGGYNVNTRFKMDKWTPPASGGTMTTPSPTKPYSYTPDGKIEVNPPAGNTTNINNVINQNTQGTPGSGHYEDVYEDKTTTKTTGGLESYKKVWERNENDLQGKYSNDFDKWVKAAEKWWAEEATEEQKAKRNKKTETTTERVKVGQKWVQDTEPTQGGDNIATITN